MKSEQSEPYERLQSLRKSSGYKTAEEAIARFGFNLHTYRSHENGARNISPKAAQKYAKAFKSTAEFILFGTGQAKASSAEFDMGYSQESLDKPYGMSSASYTGKVYKPEPGLIPVYGPAAAASDDSVMLTGEHIIGYEPCPPALSNVRGAFMMYIAGSSMEPRHYHGERVWVDPWTQPAIGQDCVAVLEEDGNAIVKRYMGREGTDFVFEQYNPPKKLKFKVKEIRAIYAVTR